MSMRPRYIAAGKRVVYAGQRQIRCSQRYRWRYYNSPRFNVQPGGSTYIKYPSGVPYSHVASSSSEEEIQAKAQHVVPFILNLVSEHAHKYESSPSVPPFFIGLSALQGAGKSVLVTLLHRALTSSPNNLPTVIFSLDDLYLTHADQVALAEANPDNPLLQHRGQPSTHDISLALQTFKSLKEGKPTKIPQYDKSAFSGQGNRVDASKWEEVNTKGSDAIRVVLFEGWSVGFRPLTDSKLSEKHASAVRSLQAPNANYQGRLGHNTLQSVTTINTALKQYEELWSYFDAFIHIDAEDALYVYKWREEQEVGLRKSRGSGMTQEEVKHFVDGYFPAYELYVETLREGVFKAEKSAAEDEGSWKGRQLRLVVGDDRKVRKVVKI